VGKVTSLHTFGPKFVGKLLDLNGQHGLDGVGRTAVYTIATVTGRTKQGEAFARCVERFLLPPSTTQLDGTTIEPRRGA
jgi:hypothetical protein